MSEQSPEPPATAESTPGRTARRTVVALAVTAVLCLAAGFGLSRFVVNPADEAARSRPPDAGPITVPVERRTLSNDVTVRGDVTYDDPVELGVETADIGERAVVTGQVPQVGATLDAGQVALEVVGRPVVVLPGRLPTYRTLRAGVTGPDVLQLKAALGALGIAAGDPASPAYDADTAAGVRALYERVGYPAPQPTDEQRAALEGAQRAVTDAEDQVASAAKALETAGRGAPASERVAADAAVRTAEQALAEARAACAAPPADGEGAPCSATAVTQAEGELDVARARRDEVGAAPDTSAEQAGLASAQRALADARDALAEARQEAITPLPAGEVVYLASLPRRVDAVDVTEGDTLSAAAAMSVSGATLQIVASAARQDAALLAVGAPGTARLDDLEVPVTVAAVDAPQAGSPGADGGGQDAGAGRTGRQTVTLTFGDLTPEQVGALQGANVRVTIPVSSTGGDVLAVPLAALTAGPGGEARVEVLDGGTSRLVEVATGLAAGGYVEVTADGLAEGDLVVVGATSRTPDDAADGSDEAAETGGATP